MSSRKGKPQALWQVSAVLFSPLSDRDCQGEGEGAGGCQEAERSQHLLMKQVKLFAPFLGENTEALGLREVRSLAQGHRASKD